MSPPIVALIGATGSGKSAIALGAAEDAGATVVAVDAFTVYRQMSVGTAKPTPAELARVPHRMVDRLDVEQTCTVRWFQDEARAAIAAAHADGRPVLLVGGSGLYFRAVVDPLEFPPTDAAVRAAVQARVEADVVAAHRRLQQLDPDAAGRIDPSNARRTTRALEVIELTGRPFSSFRTGWDGPDSIYDGLRVVGLELPRDVLWARIEARTAAMLAGGWVEECRALLDRDLSETAAQAIGYAEILAHLRGEGDGEREGEAGGDLAAVAERIAIRTRQFGARQRRWFTADPRVEWHPPSEADAAVRQALAAGP